MIKLLKKRLQRNKYVKHFVGWTFVFLGWTVFFYVPDVPLYVAPFRGIKHTFIAIPSFYLSFYVLWPQLFVRGKYIKYVFSIFLILVGNILFLEAIMLPDEWIPVQLRHFNGPDPFHPNSLPPLHMHRGLHPHPLSARIMSGGLLTLIIIFLSTILRINMDTKIRERKELEAQREQLENELKFLKLQINPHFLFNALNNVYTLTYIQSPLAPDMLLKLSNMLRYTLYETGSKKVPLEKEIEYLRDFFDFQKLKDDEIQADLHIDIDEPRLMVAPMLLITFIENSFKHSKIEDVENGWIDVHLTLKDKKLSFTAKNSIPKKSFTKDKVGGVGLTNVKRQLELLYPQKYSLEMGPKDDCFFVHLELMLA